MDILGEMNVHWKHSLDISSVMSFELNLNIRTGIHNKGFNETSHLPIW